jgi:hypothetical protein
MTSDKDRRDAGWKDITMKTLLAAGALATLLGSVAAFAPTAFAQTADTPDAAAPATDVIAADMDDSMGMGPGDGMGMGPMGPMGPMGGMLGALFGADFATLDADGDGAITEADIEARAAARFAQADADGSGGLTAAEMVAMAEIIRQEQMAARLSERLARIDDSADGEIQIEELTARAPSPVHFFDRFDSDNDGAISTAEYEAGKALMAEQAQMRREEGRPQGGWGFWNRHGDDHGPRHGN